MLPPRFFSQTIARVIENTAMKLRNLDREYNRGDILDMWEYINNVLSNMAGTLKFTDDQICLISDEFISMGYFN